MNKKLWYIHTIEYNTTVKTLWKVLCDGYVNKIHL